MAKIIDPQERELQGWGYMHRNKPREPVPDDAIWAGYVHAHSFADPVDIGGYVVSEADLASYVDRHGELPPRIVLMDYSGSVVYVYRVEWTTAERLVWSEGDLTR